MAEKGAGVAFWFRSEARSWALFAPVALGGGVALYFALSEEPAARLGQVAAAAAVALFLLARAARAWAAARIMVLAIGLAALGFAAAQYRAWSVAGPVWERSAEVVLTGRAIALEEAADGAPRLVIDQVERAGDDADPAPRRVRISFRRLAADEPEAARVRLRALLGQRVGLSARLFAPPGPAEPGAFDYRRRAWFDGVGALGSATGWPTAQGPAAASGPVDAVAAEIDVLRRAIADRARNALPDGGGEIAAALLVGDRSGLPPDAVEALRASNLAHLLAISGLHMGIVCAVVFVGMRLLLALPAAPLFRTPPKKIAALGALVVGGVYLLLAGATVPTQRAYIMALVVFVAVLADRPALTLRAVAVAAMIVLLLRPESLFDAGFQLSFAATTAMIAVFNGASGWLRARRGRRSSWRARLLNGFLSLLVASLVAGAATAPFAAYAFNRVAPYGLIANLLATPALGLWIMPMGLIAVALAPFGLEEPFFVLMGLGVDYVLAVADMVASWEGSTRPVKAGPPIALAAFALGGLALCLWRSAALRLMGAAAVLAGFWLWREAPRPEVLISERGRLIGVLGADGRAFDGRPRQRFDADYWLRRDGDDAAAPWRRRDFQNIGEWALAYSVSGLRVERAPERALDLEVYCAEPGLVVAPRAEPGAPPRADCLVLDRSTLREAGAIAVFADEEGALTVVRAAERAGERFWTDAETRARLLPRGGPISRP